MHRPLAGEFVLYPKVDGADIKEGNTKAEQDSRYQKISQHTYNSPTNIRRLFITGSRVIVHYYTPFIIKGEKHNSYIIDTKLNSDSVGLQSNYEVSNLYEVIKHILSEKNEMMEYQMNKLQDPKAKEPTTYRLEGNVLKVLSSTYACNNIEEVYFDYTALFSEELKPYFTDILSTCGSSLFNSTSFNLVKMDKLLQVFAQFNTGGNISAVKAKFPRLRNIGMISNLNAILDHNSQKQHCEFIKNAKDTRTWFDVNRQLIEASRSTVLLCNVTPGNKPNLEFNTKEAQYKFDKEVLKGAVDKYKKAIDDIIKESKQQKDTGNDEKSNDKGGEDTVLSRVDKRIIEVLDKGDSYAGLAIAIAADGLSLKERESLVDNLPNKYKVQLSKHLGLGQVK